MACESSGGLGAFSDGIERWTKPGGERGVRFLSSLCGLRKDTFRPSFQGLSVRPRYLGRTRLLLLVFFRARYMTQLAIEYMKDHIFELRRKI